MTITIKKMISSSTISPALIRAVVKQSGGLSFFSESAHDMAISIDGGFHGWIYYTETVAFTRRNKKHILALAESDATSLGMGVMEMLQGFGCMNLSQSELAAQMYTGKGADVTEIFNCLAWYAAESVARIYDDLANEGGI